MSKGLGKVLAEDRASKPCGDLVRDLPKKLQASGERILAAEILS